VGTNSVATPDVPGGFLVLSSHLNKLGRSLYHGKREI